jgi:hypothetical protein
MQAARWVTTYEVSPDGAYVAFEDNFGAYVDADGARSAGDRRGQGVASALPVAKASEGGATYLTWTEGGKRLTWSLGPTVYSASIDAMIPLTKPKSEEGYKPPTTGRRSFRRRAGGQAHRCHRAHGARALSPWPTRMAA